MSISRHWHLSVSRVLIHAQSLQGGPQSFRVANDAAHTLTTLVSFNQANGMLPRAGLVMDAEGMIASFNPAAERIFSISR